MLDRKCLWEGFSYCELPGSDPGPSWEIRLRLKPGDILGLVSDVVMDFHIWAWFSSVAFLKKSFGHQSPGVSLKCRQSDAGFMRAACSSSPAWLHVSPPPLMEALDQGLYSISLYLGFLNSWHGQYTHQKVVCKIKSGIKFLEQCLTHNKHSINTSGRYLCYYESCLFHGPELWGIPLFRDDINI